MGKPLPISELAAPDTIQTVNWANVNLGVECYFRQDETS